MPGDALGTYTVMATLDTSDCGPGAADFGDIEEFEVKLSRDGSSFYWQDEHKRSEGTIASDGITFSFEDRVEILAIEPGVGHVGCTIVRSDRVSGRLENDTFDVEQFSGRLRYGYLASANSDCSQLMAVEGGLSRLPCEVTYDMTGRRTEAPVGN